MFVVFNILVGLVGLAMFGLGMMSMLAPTKMLKNFAIEPQGVAGLNTIRGVIGGLFIACLATLITGLATGETLWFLTVAIVLGAVALGRVIGIIADGFDKSVVPPLVLELVMVAILVTAHFQLGIA